MGFSLSSQGKVLWGAAVGGPGSEGYNGKVLRMDRPLAGGFLSLTSFQAEGCGIARRAMSIISRLRRSRQHRVSILSAYLVHPFPLRGTSPQGDARSVTGLAFYVIWHDKHSADWLAALASPFPATPDFPLLRGQNKTPRGNLPICDSIVSTGYSATACEGKVVAPATKGGMHFLRPQGDCMVFPRSKARLLGFIIRGRLL